MICAIIFDCFGVIVTADGVKDPLVMELILSLRRRYKTALLSNIGQQGLNLRFTSEELSRYFDAVIISGDVGIVKPDPGIYNHATKLLGVDPNECVFIDDLEIHCEGARNIGMYAIQYRDFLQAKQELEDLLISSKD